MTKRTIVQTVIMGNRYSRMTVISEPFKKDGDKEWRIICRCDCGEERVVHARSLPSGNTKSCGCIQGDERHDMSKSREYYSWKGMIQRCQNPNHIFFELYGARGVTICDRWLDFRNFYADMGPRPPRHTLDRIDNFGDYEPNNCRWATPKTQTNNMRANRLVFYNGEWLTAMQWSEKSPVDYDTFLWRLKRGWGMEKIMSTPSKMTANKGVPKPKGFRDRG